MNNKLIIKNFRNKINHYLEDKNDYRFGIIMGHAGALLLNNIISLQRYNSFMRIIDNLK